MTQHTPEPWTVEGQANARLHVAAPDLLEALERLLDVHLFSQSLQQDNDAVACSRAAIAKAKGD